ncbi:hypothetical protein I5Z20_005249, partial [Escherichia coli]|nr:hypothetical protein [Escherichia coli]
CYIFLGQRALVENNLLGGSECLQTEKAREHGADVLSCSDNPSGEACKRGQAENKAYAAALAAGGCYRGVPKLCGYLVPEQMP